MAAYIVRFNTAIDIAVTIESIDPDLAADEAWPKANAVWGDGRDITAEATLDGIGAYEVEEKP
jgi:hypothetical protein